MYSRLRKGVGIRIFIQPGDEQLTHKSSRHRRFELPSSWALPAIEGDVGVWQRNRPRPNVMEPPVVNVNRKGLIRTTHIN